MKNAFPFLLLLLACSCKQTEETTTEIIKVDASKEYPAKEISLQDIADIEYIRIPTSDSTLVNNTISAVSEEGIIAWGWQPGEILLFSRNGQNLQGRIWLTGHALDTVFQLLPDQTLKPVMMPQRAPTKDVDAPLLYFLGLNDYYAWVSWIPRHVTVRMGEMQTGKDELKKLSMLNRKSGEWFEPIYRNDAFSDRNLDPKFIKTQNIPYGYGLILLDAMDLVEAYQNNEITDKQLKQIASTLKKDDNPILMLLHFKER